MASLLSGNCGGSQTALLAVFFLVFLGFLWPVLAEKTEQEFRIGWVLANPDGRYTRPVVGVNGAWPPPPIRATVGDRLALRVVNELGNASTSLHFHGFFQNGTNHMDGAAGVTQCDIPPGESFLYEIRFEQPGTYWYHAHSRAQYIDGLRGTVVVHDPQGPYEGQYDEELVLSLSDWYHKPSEQLIGELINVENPSGAEPMPQSALMNDTQDLRLGVQPNRTYLVRLVNIGGFAAHYVWFEDHSLHVVEVDGVWTQPLFTDRLYISPAQRYSVLLTTGAGADRNFAVVAAMDQELFDDIPDDIEANVTGWLVYDDTKPLPRPAPVDDLKDGVLDDTALVPIDGQALLGPVEISIKLEVKMDNLGDGANYAFFNDVTYVPPKVPSLYTALSVGGSNASDARVYGAYSLPQLLPHNAIVEVVLVNGDDGKHPFHLHGHNFQVVHRSDVNGGLYLPGLDSLDGSDSHHLPSVPMRRDTVLVNGNGYAVLRFRADNPGVWLFHCHIQWHMDQGLVATFIEAPEQLPDLLTLPPDHLQACRSAGTPTRGNAAGNTHDVFDLRGENRPPSPLPDGFTAKGYIALFCSCVSGLLGLAVITWYGIIDPGG